MQTSDYWNNIPYDKYHDGMSNWASSLGPGTAITSASLVRNAQGYWVITVNGSTEIGKFKGASTAVTALYHRYKFLGGTDFDTLSGSLTPTLDQRPGFATGIFRNEINVSIGSGVWEDFTDNPTIDYRNTQGETTSSSPLDGTNDVAVDVNAQFALIEGDLSVPARYSYQELILPGTTHTPNTDPLYLSNFASTETEADWGTSNVNYRKTPIDAAADSAFQSSVTNGRLKFYETGGFYDAADNGFGRFMVANAGGFFHQGTDWANSSWNDQGEPKTYGVKGYNCNSYTLMNAPYARSYVSADPVTNPLLVAGFQGTEPGREADGNMDGTDIDDWITDDPANPSWVADWWIPTVYTDTGLNTGNQGNSRKAWKFANQALQSRCTAAGLGTSAELIQQWDWTPIYAYVNGSKTDPATPVNLVGGYDRLTGSVDFQATDGPVRNIKPNVTDGYTFDTGFWDVEINGMTGTGTDQCEFTGMSWGVSGNSWQEGGNTAVYSQAIKSNYPGKPFIFEAIPLTSTFTGSDKRYHPYGTTVVEVNPPAQNYAGLPDDRYQAAAHWAFFPQFFGSSTIETQIDGGGSPLLGTGIVGGGRDIDNIYFTPSLHEMHCVFDVGQLHFGGEAVLNEIGLYKLFDHVWQRGYIVSLCNLARDGSQARIDAIWRIMAYVQALNNWTVGSGLHTATVPSDAAGTGYDDAYLPQSGSGGTEVAAGTRVITRSEDPAGSFYQ